jgi:uncharacterized protein
MQRRIAALAVAAGALAVPAAAQAHVTVQPTSVPAGAETVLTVRVPNERDDASTVKVDVKLPPGFVSASWEAIPGWSVRAVKQKLSKPVQTDDGPIDEQVGEIVWTAADRKAGIQPGEFRDFPLSVVIPGKAGQTLTFKALQTAAAGTGPRQQANPQPAPAAASTDSGSSDTLSIVALIVGALGLVVAAVAVAMARGSRSAVR